MKIGLLNFYIILWVLFFTVTKSLSQYDQKYVIGPWPDGGLGACLHAVLNHLNYCELENKVPVIYWGEDSLYYNKSGFNDSYNVWEYYFEPVSNFSYVPGEPVYLYYDIPYDRFKYCKITGDNRLYAFQLINKYIKFKPVVYEKIDQFYQTYMAGKKTIGIHLRGTDKSCEEKLVSPRKMAYQAFKHADKDTQFLIASDEKQLFDIMVDFLQKQERTVIYYDCYRATNGQPLHTSTLQSGPSRAQLGEDVLVEMALLARCDLLVHTFSNVSSFVLYLNPYLKSLLLR